MAHQGGIPHFSKDDLNENMGVRFIGMLFHLMLDAFVASQAFAYFSRYGGRNGDAWFIQTMAGYVTLATVIGSTLVFTTLYEVHVLHFMNPKFIFAVPSSFGASIFVGSTVAAAVQTAFVGRCYRLLGRPKWFWFIFVIPIAYVVFGSMAIEIYNEHNSNFNPQDSKVFKGLFCAWLSTTMAVDLVITGVLLYRFQDLSRDLFFEGTKNILVRFLIMSMTTCLLTTSVTAITFILYFCEGPHKWHLLTRETLSSLYAASFFAQLTGRKTMQPGAEHTGSKFSGTQSFTRNTTSHPSTQPTYSVTVQKFDEYGNEFDLDVRKQSLSGVREKAEDEAMI